MLGDGPAHPRLDAPLGDLVHVISCLIFYDETMSSILLGVRRDTPSSRRHPGVLSTPTMRIPKPYFRTLLGYPGLPLKDPGVVQLEPGLPLTVGGFNSCGNPALFTIESLLARKLGLARALTMGRFTAEATGITVALDSVDDPLGTGQAEWTAMITYSLTITNGASEFPPETAAYSRLIWAPADRLGEAYASHDALMLDDSLDPFEVCISGLCIRSAVFALSRSPENAIPQQLPSMLE